MSHVGPVLRGFRRKGNIVEAGAGPHAADMPHALHDARVQAGGDDHGGPGAAHAAQLRPQHAGKFDPPRKGLTGQHLGKQRHAAAPVAEKFVGGLPVEGNPHGSVRPGLDLRHGQGGFAQGVPQGGGLLRQARRGGTVQQDQGVRRGGGLKFAHGQFPLAGGQLPMHALEGVPGAIGPGVLRTGQILRDAVLGGAPFLSLQKAQGSDLEAPGQHQQGGGGLLAGQGKAEQPQDIADERLVHAHPGLAHMGDGEFQFQAGAAVAQGQKVLLRPVADA